MSLLGAPAPRVWGVRQLINYVGKAIANDPRLSDLGVRGEITGLSRPPSGHVYFGLKEPSGATIKCFVRSSYARALPDIQNGIEATAYGSLGVYPDRSELSLNVASVELGGAGKLAAVYERIKRNSSKRDCSTPPASARCRASRSASPSCRRPERTARRTFSASSARRRPRRS